jgi:hypothetical protein
MNKCISNMKYGNRTVQIKVTFSRVPLVSALVQNLIKTRSCVPGMKHAELRTDTFLQHTPMLFSLCKSSTCRRQNWHVLQELSLCDLIQLFRINPMYLIADGAQKVIT